MADGLDGRRQLVGIDPDEDLSPYASTRLTLVPMWTARWAVLIGAGQSLLAPRLVTAPDGLQTEREPDPHAGEQPK
jgi:hypothetical protein